MTLMLKKLLGLACFVLLAEAQRDVYWKDYNVDIPNDAVPSGIVGVYIAQGLGLYNGVYGIIPAPVRIGQESLVLPLGDIPVSAENSTIKVLCSVDTAQFQWITTSSTSFFDDVAKNHPIRGGTQFDADGTQKILYIGRVEDNGVKTIGKIETSHISELAIIYYVTTTNELANATTFEVLRSFYAPP